MASPLLARLREPLLGSFLRGLPVGTFRPSVIDLTREPVKRRPILGGLTNENERAA